MYLNLLLKEKLKKKKKKTEEGTGDLIGNKNVVKITKVSKTSPQNNLERVTNEEKRYIFLEQRQKITDDLRLI